MTEVLKEITEWEVKTPTGWQSFEGVKKVSGVPHRVVTLWSESNPLLPLRCSGTHQIVVRRGEEVQPLFADMVEVGDQVLSQTGSVDEQSADHLWTMVTGHTVESEFSGDLYDLVNVGRDRVFFANNVAVHNCAHIREFEDLWAALFPTLSTGGSCILISTPNGVGNTFHRIWTDAKAGTNDFIPIELPWTVHPDHDEAWFQTQKTALKSERLIAQELLCSFESSGKSFLTGDEIRELEQHTQTPVGYWETNPDLWVWRWSNPGDKYLITADVSRGNADDFSAFHVINMSTDQAVAEYKGKMQPDHFGVFLAEVGTRYNDALICIENNGVGVATGYKLQELKYPNLYYQKFAKFGVHTTYDEEDIRGECPGFYLGTQNRVEILAYLDQTLRNRKIRVFSQRFFEELKTFVWVDNAKAKALKGYNDDLCMSLALACYLYEASGRNPDDRGDIREILLASIGGNVQTLQSLVPTPGSLTSGGGNLITGPSPVYTDSMLSGPSSPRQTSPGGGWSQWINDLTR